MVIDLHKFEATLVREGRTRQTKRTRFYARQFTDPVISFNFPPLWLTIKIKPPSNAFIALPRNSRCFRKKKPN